MVVHAGWGVGNSFENGGLWHGDRWAMQSGSGADSAIPFCVHDLGCLTLLDSPLSNHLASGYGSGAAC